ncbi:MAG: GNAT family N-acetyltransferase, partial [Planctomycetota bacterium]|nr:GNAT family N-acetyltransferase [Planctomycetota bacterium]
MAAHETGLKVRRAAAADTDEMLRVIGQAFGTPERPFWDCRRELPYLFHEGRIGDHFVCEDAGRIVGVIGLYPYDFRYESVIFRSAGVGQVGTLPEYRGRGVMSAILREVCRAIYEDGIDFAWLGGDRLRYGRYGWARGGFSLRFDLSDRYLPPPPPDGAVRPLDAARDFDMVRAAVYGAGSGILMPDAELRMRLSGPGMGWVMGGSFVVSHYKREDTIVLADGNAAEIATLLSHHLAHLRKSNAALSRVVAMVGPHPTPLMRACY